MKPEWITSLEQTLQDVGAETTLTLHWSRDFWDEPASVAEYAQLEREFHAAYGAAAEEIRVAWGEPAFSGTAGDPDFPDWCPGQELSFWRKEGRIACLWWEHQDQELPFLLRAGVLAEDPDRDTS